MRDDNILAIMDVMDGRSEDDIHRLCDALEVLISQTSEAPERPESVPENVGRAS